jgi:thiamine pyrophosphate-dependent acetolactate synthase large subunit-like protein
MVYLIAVLTSALMRPPHSYSYDERAPDFVKLAEALGAKGLRCAHTADLDQSHAAIPAHAGPVLLAWPIDKQENYLPVICSGLAHNDMILPIISRRLMDISSPDAFQTA